MKLPLFSNPLTYAALKGVNLQCLHQLGRFTLIITLHNFFTGPSGEAPGGDTGSGDQAPPTSLLELGLSDSEPKQVPSDSDVLAILSSAHKSSSTVTSENLRHVQKVGHHTAGREKGRQRDKVAHSSKVGRGQSTMYIVRLSGQV